MNLTAYDEYDKPLFCRAATNQVQARSLILNGHQASLVNYVIFKGKRYPIAQVYKW